MTAPSIDYVAIADRSLAPRRVRGQRMMKQEWTSGTIVKVGFLTLRAVRKLTTREGPFDPYPWELESIDGTRVYHFTPHHGLKRVI
jgi:hypothetical protein